MASALLYLETARHLRARQLVGWAAEQLPKRPVVRTSLVLRQRTGEWVEGYLRSVSMLPGRVAWLLNRSETVEDWDAPERPRLWNYHLHYFEDPRVSADWISRWIAENPVGEGTGWEPYPLSRRIVNWIRWVGRFERGVAGLDLSLAAQARALYSQIEYRLLANHLFANAKALVYAGTYFEGPEAERWLAKGLALLDAEVVEQVLADGGHCERSPLYHALVLEDLLDLESLRLAYPAAWALRPGWLDAVSRMLGWLRLMTHPDGEIAFFQDACFGVAATYGELVAYAERMGLGTATATPQLTLWASDGRDGSHSYRCGLGAGAAATTGTVVARGMTGVAGKTSGYRRLEVGPLVVLFDGGGPGPDYQPGHAHAGTLSVEVSWRGERVVVNSGTSTYEEGAVRAFERSTEAHATVRVDGRDSSEMWGAFRVARRARVRERRDGECWTEAEHTGYEPVRHRRRVLVAERELVITDWINTTGTRSPSFAAEWFFPLHPSVEVRGMELWRADWRIGRVTAPAGVKVTVEKVEWRPEFNRRVPASRLRFEGSGSGEYVTRFCFEDVP